MARILIVDDAAFMRQVLKEMLRKNKYDICAEAANGSEAILKYKGFKPDLVILDILMPDMNGLDTLKEIVGFDRNANVIMCTALGERETVIEAVRYGAKDFIVKPFQENRILESIKRIIG